MIKPPIPNPPYPYRQDMQWRMDQNCIFVFDNNEPVMAISISEVIGEIKRMERDRIATHQGRDSANNGAEGAG